MNKINLTTLKQTSQPKHHLFIAFFGISIAAFAAGFGDCLFDPDTAGACVAHAASWVDRFKAVGDHLITWITALITAAF